MIVDAAMLGRQAMATARLMRDLPGYARRAVDVDESARLVSERAAVREAQFMRHARQSIFSCDRSPHRRLLDHIGCKPEDLRELVTREGLEAALSRLRREGVYTTQAELKGRIDIVRGSLRFRPAPADFYNPRLRPHFVVPTSGSTGTQLFVGRALGEHAENGDATGVALGTFGMRRPAYVKWSILPHATAEKIRIGLPIVAWFNSVANVPLGVRALQAVICVAARLGGGHVAWPRDRPLTEPDVIARWLGATLRQHPEGIFIDATASSVTRASAAAIDLGISLEGVLWLPWGEPHTPARERTIRESGARSMGMYSTEETGPLAVGCAMRTGADEMHLRTERFGFLLAPSLGHDVSTPLALHVTTLGDFAPVVMLNTQSGDTADEVDGTCDCAMHQAGLTRRVVNIRSFEKLTGEGITLVDADVVAAIEEVLPATIGGRHGDYQLLEAESESGLTRFVLRIHPDVPNVDERVARTTLLTSISASSEFSRHMARVIELTDAVRIERRTPWTTASGKLPAFVPLRARRPAEGTDPHGRRADYE